MYLFRLLAIPLCFYVAGLALYSNLFVFSATQSAYGQAFKVFAASFFCLFALAFVPLAQSKRRALQLVGYISLVAYFSYLFFLVGYFSYFGFVPEIYAFGFGSAADAVGVQDHYFDQIFGVREIILIVCFILLMYLLPTTKLPKLSYTLLALPVLLFSYNVLQFGMPKESEHFGNAAVIRRFGLPAFLVQSSADWFNLEAGYLASETPFPGALGPLAGGEPPVDGEQLAVRADRVVLIQIESFDPEAIDATLNGRDVMPFVANLYRTHCQSYTDHYTIKSVGGSSDSEFAVMTGRFPSRRIQSMRHADFAGVDTLYERLHNSGVASYFAHNNNIGYYGRHLAYGQLEMVESDFITPGVAEGEIEFATRTLSNALASSDRTFYYFFNFQSHGPFQGYSAETRAAFGIEQNADTSTNYLATMHEVDQTIEAMFELQREPFEAGRSLFIVTADHPSYLNTEENEISRANIPLLVCHADLEPGRNEMVSSPIDLYPTILDAFGLPSNPSIGENLLSGGSGVTLLPSELILFRQEDGSLGQQRCDGRCDAFFDYTDQIIRLGQ